jgi:amino-acid N-acetyltransferase
LHGKALDVCFFQLHAAGMPLVLSHCGAECRASAAAGLGVRLVIVLGSQQQIDANLREQGREPEFVGGYRVTDRAALLAAVEASGCSRMEVCGGRARPQRAAHCHMWCSGHPSLRHCSQDECSRCKSGRPAPS